MPILLTDAFVFQVHYNVICEFLVSMKYVPLFRSKQNNLLDLKQYIILIGVHAYPRKSIKIATVNLIN